MATTTLTIGSRRSLLAQVQTNLVRDMLRAAWPTLAVEITFIDTQGDLNRHDPLPAIGGKGLFTAELEAALREGRIDLAVHSLKDLPVEDSPGLAVLAIPERAEPQDMLISHRAGRIEDLPPGAVVGSSSLRRAAQLLARRPDLHLKDIRGNVDTRLRKLDDPAQGYDAIILARAGLSRLGHTALPHAHPIPLAVMLPAPGQGALGIQARADDPATGRYLQTLEHAPTRAAVTAERAFLAGLGGGCSVPVAALGTVAEGHLVPIRKLAGRAPTPGPAAAWEPPLLRFSDRILTLQALVATPDGRQVIRVNGRDSIEAAQALGQHLAMEALSQGAGELLRR